jgi:hypothetical protein
MYRHNRRAIEAEFGLIRAGAIKSQFVDLTSKMADAVASPPGDRSKTTQTSARPQRPLASSARRSLSASPPDAKSAFTTLSNFRQSRTVAVDPS